MTKIPVACCLTVFTEEQLSEHKGVSDELWSRRVGVIELENGFKHQFPGDSSTLELANRWVSMERKCCPFMTFAVITSHEDEPIFVQLTGNEDVTLFLKNEMNPQISNRLTERYSTELDQR